MCAFQRVNSLVRLLCGRFNGNKPFYKLRVRLPLFPLFGSDTAALVAVVVALVLAAQTVWLRLRPQPRPAVG